LFFKFFFYFGLHHSLAQTAGAETVISTIEHYLYSPSLAFVSTAEMLTFVFHTQHTHIKWKYQQQVHEILFGLVHHHFIHVSASGQLDLAFNDALYRFVLGIGSIYGGISLQSGDKIIAVIAGVGQHCDVSGMQHVKGRKGYANPLALCFEFFDVIEYHDTILFQILSFSCLPGR
jgi:hypothetical protein